MVEQLHDELLLGLLDLARSQIEMLQKNCASAICAHCCLERNTDSDSDF